MYSTVLLTLLGAALPAIAGRTNPQDFRLRSSPGYAEAASVASNRELRFLKRSDYLETANELVHRLAPNVTYRVVNDHYVGTNGIAHVHLQQTLNGLDVKNAVFNVNVGAR